VEGPVLRRCLQGQYNSRVRSAVEGPVLACGRGPREGPISVVMGDQRPRPEDHFNPLFSTFS
jgi:hypothetical protein